MADPTAIGENVLPEFRANLEKVLLRAKANRCEHEFSGWREFDDGRGGEQFCQKCGAGAMAVDAWGD